MKPETGRKSLGIGVAVLTGAGLLALSLGVPQGCGGGVEPAAPLASSKGALEQADLKDEQATDRHPLWCCYGGSKSCCVKDNKTIEASGDERKEVKPIELSEQEMKAASEEPAPIEEMIKQSDSTISKNPIESAAGAFTVSEAFACPTAIDMCQPQAGGATFTYFDGSTAFIAISNQLTPLHTRLAPMTSGDPCVASGNYTPMSGPANVTSATSGRLHPLMTSWMYFSCIYDGALVQQIRVVPVGDTCSQTSPGQFICGHGTIDTGVTEQNPTGEPTNPE